MVPESHHFGKENAVLNEFERQVLDELRKAPEPTKPDEDDMFGHMIAATLKKLTSQQSSFAKLKMQQLLYDLQFSPNTLYFSQQESLY